MIKIRKERKRTLGKTSSCIRSKGNIDGLPQKLFDGQRPILPCKCSEARFEILQETTCTNEIRTVRPYRTLSVLATLSRFKLACNDNVIQDVAEIWLISQFLEQAAAVAMRARLLLKHKSSQERTKKDVPKTYSQVVHHLLESEATNNVTAEADTSKICFTHPIQNNTSRRASANWMKASQVPQLVE